MTHHAGLILPLPLGSFPEKNGPEIFRKGLNSEREGEKEEPCQHLSLIKAEESLYFPTSKNQTENKLLARINIIKQFRN